MKAEQKHTTENRPRNCSRPGNRSSNRLASGWLALVVITAMLSPIEAGVLTFTEDFTAKTHSDTTLTTAWWDTASGQLRYYPFQPSHVGSLPPGSYSHAVAISGDYAYVADDATSGLRIVDISDPTSPVYVGQYLTPGNAWGVDVAGDYAYVADNQRLVIVNISNPASPTLAGTGPYIGSGGARDVMVAGNHAWVAFGANGLRVYDVTNPASPVYVGLYDSPGTATRVFIDGDYAYLADGASGLHILNIADPTWPVLLGTYDTSGSAGSVEVHGDHAFVGDGSQGLVVIDVSTPSAPVLAGSYNTLGVANGVTVSGDYAFVAWGSHGLKMIDVSDPANPAVVWNLPVADAGWPRDVVVAGEHVFMATGAGGMQVAKVAKLRDTPEYVDGFGNNVAKGFRADGDYAYLLQSGLHIIDVQDPKSPTTLTTYPVFQTYPYDLALAGDIMYIVGTNDAMMVVDVSNPLAPAQLDVVATSGTGYSIVVEGDHAYVAAALGGLDVFDIQDPTNVAFLANHDPGSLSSVDVSGDIAVAAGYEFYVYDVSTPGSPSVIGSYTPTGDTYSGVALHGDYAFVGARGNGVAVFDISNPASPTLVELEATAYDTRGIAITGNVCFVGEALNLTIWNAADPTNLSFVGQSSEWATGSVSLWGDFVLGGPYGNMWRAFDKIFDSDQNEGYSSKLNDLNLRILTASLETTQTGEIQWELSADGGANWQPWPTGGFDTGFNNPGSDLRWRATFERSGLGDPTWCSDLTIDWLYENPILTSVSDIPGDQGRQARVSWRASGYDRMLGGVVQYAIYRRWDPMTAGPAAIAARAAKRPDPGPLAALPPGEWDFVTTVPATVDENYSVVVPTAADSTITSGMYYTVFFVSAMTATLGTQYDSPPDSGYSVDNLAPTAPQNLAVSENTGSGNALVWDECPDSDFQHFRIYRGDDPGFTPGPANLVAATTGTAWSDPDFDGWSKSYKTTAVDYSGNESDASSPVIATGIGTPKPPEHNALYQNVPNPFNPSTTIHYSLREAGDVTLTVFDAVGRRVRTLVDTAMPAGVHDVSWDGLDQRGNRVASGVYFYRLQAGVFTQTKKMVMLK